MMRLAFDTGIAPVFRSWLALLFAGLMALVLLWRIRDEEALLKQAYGSDWESYSARSWRLIPFFY